MAKDKQMEFVKFPERTPLGKKAIEYLNLRDKQKNLEDQISKVREELILEFKKIGLSKIKIEKITLTYSHTEKDKIVCKGLGEEV
jgi:hypothetical protein